MSSAFLAVVFGILAILFACQIAISLRKGWVVSKTGKVQRATAPLQFWTAQVFGVAFFALFLLLSVATTLGWLSK